ncbi:hypothetical protein LQK93_03480 [Terrabacter sp. BE26]
MPGSRASELLANPWQGARQIPRPAHGGGRTVRELAETTGKHQSTITRHLKALEQAGLVLQERAGDGRTLWWRLRFDPEQIADRDQVPDTAEAKAHKHARERRAFLLSLSEDEDSRVKRVTLEETVLLVDGRTGAVLDEVPTGQPDHGQGGACNP